MELAGSSWTLVSFETSKEVLVAATEQPATLIFLEKGEQGNRISGSGGCNRYFGSYTVTNNQITFSPLGSTRMMCGPNRMAQENHFLQALSTAERFERNDSELLITYAEGILRFVQS